VQNFRLMLHVHGLSGNAKTSLCVNLLIAQVSSGFPWLPRNHKVTKPDLANAERVQ
jgi:hypothetical protein